MPYPFSNDKNDLQNAVDKWKKNGSPGAIAAATSGQAPIDPVVQWQLAEAAKALAAKQKLHAEIEAARARSVARINSWVK